MNRYGQLNVVQEYLGKKGVLIALDYGVHYACLIESNCTEAIKLRKVLSEAKIDIPTLLKEIEQDFKTRQTNPDPVSLPSFPEFSGQAEIIVAGQRVTVNLKEQLEQQLAHYFRNELEIFRNQKSLLIHVGKDLYHNYLAYIQEARKNKTLPQCTVPAKMLLENKCTVAYGDKESWLFFFPFEYSPQWLTIDDHRYKLCDEHITALKREGILSMFQVMTSGKLVALRLVYPNMEKFIHYHGSRYDCWGQLRFPKTWDNKLKTLVDLNYTAQAALTTINRDSLMLNDPCDMIPVAKLMDKATEMGREGVKNKKKPEPETPPEVVQQEVTQQGRRRRTEQPLPPIEFVGVDPNGTAPPVTTTTDGATATIREGTNAAPEHWGEGR